MVGAMRRSKTDWRRARKSRPDAENPEIISFGGAVLRKNFVVLGTLPPKKQITLRIDASLLAWYQALGAGYQTHMERALAEYFARLAKRKRK